MGTYSSRVLVQLAIVVSALMAFCEVACDSPGTDSNTNWVRPCDEDHDCGSSLLVCRSGYCARREQGLRDATAFDAGESSGGAGGRDSNASAGFEGRGGRNASTDASDTGEIGTGSVDAGDAFDSEVPVGTAGASGDGSADGTGGSLRDARADGPAIPIDGTGTLDFSFPPRHAATDADGIRVSGIVDPRTSVVRVSVNSVPADSLEGSFARWRTSRDVPLASGVNELQIVAETENGQILTLTGKIWRGSADVLEQPAPPLPPDGGSHSDDFAVPGGPVLTGFRDVPFTGAVLADGRLVVLDLFTGATVLLDPATGQRRSLQLPTPGVISSDPSTGGIFVSNSDGLYRVDENFESASRIAVLNGIGGWFASDPSRNMAYGFSLDGIIALDTATGQVHTIHVSAAFTSSYAGSLNNPMILSSVSPDHNTVFYWSSGGHTGGGCFEFDLTTGDMSQYPECQMLAAPDGRLVSLHIEGEVYIVDPETTAATVFSSAPLHGRGFALIGGPANAFVADPRRDRWWVVTATYDPSGPNRYFAIDPFSGDRVLVSD
jgi:hypothetical protein